MRMLGTPCPECGLTSGTYVDDLRGKANCDNCGWYEGKVLAASTKRVLKWDVPVDDHDHPIGAGRVVLVACQNNPTVVQVWTEEEVTSPPQQKVRAARVYGTGHHIPDEDVHLGSALAGPLVWHVYGGNR